MLKSPVPHFYPQMPLDTGGLFSEMRLDYNVHPEKKLNNSRPKLVYLKSSALVHIAWMADSDVGDLIELSQRRPMRQTQ